MTTLLITHSSFVDHDTGVGHPERADRMRALDKVFASEIFNALAREEAPLRKDLEAAIVRAHPQAYYDAIVAAKPSAGGTNRAARSLTPVMSSGSWQAVSRAVGAGLEAVDRVMAGNRRHQERILSGPPARPSCRDSARHGVLCFQQHRDSGDVRTRKVRTRPCCRRGL